MKTKGCGEKLGPAVSCADHINNYDWKVNLHGVDVGLIMPRWSDDSTAKQAPAYAVELS